MSEYSLSATLKAGTGFDAPWVVVYANNPDELNGKLRGVIEGETIELVVAGAAALRTAFQLGAVPADPPQRQQPAQAAPAAAPAPASNVVQGGWGSGPQGEARNGDVTGKVCPECGTAVAIKTITFRTGPKAGQQGRVEACPNNKSRNDNHYSRWL